MVGYPGRGWMRRELGQLSLADGLVEGGAGRNRQLEQIAALMDWRRFEWLLLGEWNIFRHDAIMALMVDGPRSRRR